MSKPKTKKQKTMHVPPQVAKHWYSKVVQQRRKQTLVYYRSRKPWEWYQ